jgi:hypothetical protein
LFVEGVHHLDVEHGWFIETARGVVKQDEGVFEEPGVDDERERYADQSRIGREREQQCENDDDSGGPAACGAQGVAQ